MTTPKNVDAQALVEALALEVAKELRDLRQRLASLEARQTKRKAPAKGAAK